MAAGEEFLRRGGTPRQKEQKTNAGVVWSCGLGRVGSSWSGTPPLRTSRGHSVRAWAAPAASGTLQRGEASEPGSGVAPLLVRPANIDSQRTVATCRGRRHTARSWPYPHWDSWAQAEPGMRSAGPAGCPNDYHRNRASRPYCFCRAHGQRTSAHTRSLCGWIPKPWFQLRRMWQRKLRALGSFPGEPLGDAIRW